MNCLLVVYRESFLCMRSTEPCIQENFGSWGNLAPCEGTQIQTKILLAWLCADPSDSCTQQLRPSSFVHLQSDYW